MNMLEYDRESDSLYVNISSKKAYTTLEVSERVGVDASQSGQVVGVEILEASRWLSEIFQKTVSKDKVRNLLCKITEGDSINLDLTLDDTTVKYALPKPYFSPVLSV